MEEKHVSGECTFILLLYFILYINVLLCKKEACQVWGKSFKRFSSNRGHRFKKCDFVKNANKVLIIAYMWMEFWFVY